VGSTYKIDDENVQLIQHPRTLMYERPDREGVHIVGGHTGDAASLAAIQLVADEQRSGAEVEPAFTFQYRKQPFRSASYSSAPLSNVIRAQIFYKSGRVSACRGILLEYRDGSKRALGQCKLGVDPSKECMDPTQLCYNNLRKNTVQVKISNGTSHPRHEETGWTCCSMRGVLEFWFSERDEELNWKE
jgi:hypothetical protein